jgi:hypothetical protein
MKSAAAARDKSASDRRLDEVADLLALAISRTSARRMSAQSRESSTGLCAPIERVLVPGAKASLPDLKARYRDLFGVEAPGINRNYLERRIAYKLQELAYGRLSQATQARLEPLAQTADKGSTPRTRMRAQDRPLAGTRLLRVWNGVEYSVTVLQPATLQLSDLEGPFSIDWEQQRAAFGFTAARQA